ncbi:MAG: DUF6198 family protein [Solobacterium sp.]|nr:DUF6198 family protein [Solobacterium sp.]
MNKKVFYTEAAYIPGIVLTALGAALMEHSGMGLSMIVAPAYLLHLKISQLLPWFTFGKAEYLVQALLIAACVILRRRFRKKYLFSFVTAVIYGAVLDLFMGMLPQAYGTVMRMLMFTAGMTVCAGGISFMFFTFLAPEAYELFVQEAAEYSGRPVPAVKTVYDISSLLVSVVLSLLFFGGLKGIGPGTVVCSLLNGTLIGFFMKLLENTFVFRDATSLRSFFEG